MRLPKIIQYGLGNKFASKNYSSGDRQCWQAKSGMDNEFSW